MHPDIWRQQDETFGIRARPHELDGGGCLWRAGNRGGQPGQLARVQLAGVQRRLHHGARPAARLRRQREVRAVPVDLRLLLQERAGRPRRRGHEARRPGRADHALAAGQLAPVDHPQPGHPGDLQPARARARTDPLAGVIAIVNLTP